VDQLSSRGRQEGEHLQGGRGHHHQAPCHPWKQVTRALINTFTAHLHTQGESMHATPN
jgi:hypothetical protein